MGLPLHSLPVGGGASKEAPFIRGEEGLGRGQRLCSSYVGLVEMGAGLLGRCPASDGPHHACPSARGPVTPGGFSGLSLGLLGLCQALGTLVELRGRGPIFPLFLAPADVGVGVQQGEGCLRIDFR